MKINVKLSVAFLLISLLSLTVISSISYFIAKKSFTQQILNQLQSVASIQKSRAKAIVDQNLERLVLVSSRTQLRLSLESFIRDPKVEYQDKMNRILRDARSSISSFNDISVLTLDGKVVASTEPAKIGAKHSGEEFFVRGQTENSADLFYLDKDKNLRAHLSGPLYLENKLLGVVAIEADVDNIISLVRDYSGLGETGETLIAKRDEDGDALFVAPLRFDQYAALKKVVSKDNLNDPITQALLKDEKLLADAVDYRAQPVLAATRYVEKTGWGLVVKMDTTEAFAPITQLRNLLAIIIFACSIVTTLISLYLARSITRPVINLTHAAQKISEGDLSARAEATSTDEIGTLGQAFNEMAETLMMDIAGRKRVEEELEKHREHLEELIRERTAELEKRVSEVEQLNSAMVNLMEDLRLSNENLETTTHQLGNANKELEAFAYSVSHDLRAPLRTIDGFSQILLEDYSDTLDKQGKHYLQRARAGTQKMGQLIDDILNLSRIGRQAMDKKEINMESIAEEVYNSLEDEWKGRKVDFNVHKCPPAAADLNLIKIVFMNLISNALKFTINRKTAKIEVGSEIEDKQTVFFVKDNGVGFDMKYVDKLFTPFQRLHRIEEYEGTGIGLAIVQRIIHRHGGQIWVESKVDVGTTFYFTV